MVGFAHGSGVTELWEFFMFVCVCVFMHMHVHTYLDLEGVGFHLLPYLSWDMNIGPLS